MQLPNLLDEVHAIFKERDKVHPSLLISVQTVFRTNPTKHVHNTGQP